MKRARIVKALLTLIVGIIGLTAIVYAVNLARHVGGKGGMIAAWAGISNPRGQFPEHDRINILLIGKDYNHTNKGIRYTKGSRSDTIIMVSLDLENKKVSALSIPRDTPWGKGKINAAYSHGGEKLCRKAVSDLTGVKADYYIALKPDAVKTMVDMLGGVDVDVKDRMKYDDSWDQLHIDFQPGHQVINGDQALGFVRFRKSNKGLPHSEEEGDDHRMARQQQLLKAMARKAKQPQMLMKADNLIDTALGAVETDLTRTQLLAVATLFRDTQPEQIQTASLVGTDARVNGLYVYELDPVKTKALVDWLLRGNEAAAYRITTVEVRNRTKVPGAARKVTNLLKAKGFDARSDAAAGMVNAKAPITATHIVYTKAVLAERAQRIAQFLGTGIVVKETPVPLAKGKPAHSDDAADITVLVGQDLAQTFVTRSALQ